MFFADEMQCTDSMMRFWKILCDNSSDGGSGIFVEKRVNIIAAYAFDACETGTSVAMILTMWNGANLIFKDSESE